MACGFVMTPYYKILNYIVHDNSSIDVIGVLLGKRKLEPVATKSRKTSVKMQISSFTVSRLFINSDIDEVKLFRKKVKSVIVVGTIKCILPDVKWYYKSCSKCTKRVHRKISSKEIANQVSLLEDGIEWDFHSLSLDETPYSTKLKGLRNEDVMNDNTSQDVETPTALKRKLVETSDCDDHGATQQISPTLTEKMR
ncbi:hypothetical protein QVD17_30324 [Tagetes erecta]|uniref:Uncharacterized protein n=1 Tax=Tagetes erecta TaxID=13708 RepID=A0AAD8K1P2_TARER|nr:hypothetical protein QVD17_30324 [Tagetes erecta]